MGALNVRQMFLAKRVFRNKDSNFYEVTGVLIEIGTVGIVSYLSLSWSTFLSINCPHAASISSPRDRRIVAGMW